MKIIKSELQISLQEMDKLAVSSLSKERTFTLAEMKSQVVKISKSSISKMKKKFF